ncbi:hypothetical protein SLE2022_108870 [Rubroshorea leprosula]
MERGQSSNQRNNNNEFILPDNFSELSLKTIENIQRRCRKGLEPGTVRYMRDNRCPGYGWLLPGWLAEERVVASGRVYKHYYDPSGRLYRTQFEVLYAWEKAGLILLDS